MESVFLSYTYRPHPAHQATLDLLRRYAVRTLEAMGLRIVDGVDVGGRPLDAAIQQRIKDTDALIALVTPQADDQGQEVNPGFVLSEFQFAEGASKPTMRVIQNGLPIGGLGMNNEYTPYVPGKEVDVVLKVMHTVAVWRRELGRKARVRLEPQELAASYDEGSGDYFEFQVISPAGNMRNYERGKLGLEPGAAYALLPNLREGEHVRLRLRQGDKTWQSKYVIDPFVGGVRLEEQV